MEHYTFNNSHLPKVVLIPIHFLLTLFLSLITINIIIKTLDFFRIGSDWLQSNVEIGFMIILLISVISILIFDTLLTSITDTGGLITVFFNLMKNDYDVNKYIENSQHTIIKESDIIFEEIINKTEAEEINFTEELSMTDKTEECGDTVLFTMTLAKPKKYNDL